MNSYVVDGTVIVYQAGTTNELFTTTTGELGSFTLPNNLSGILRVDISGGYEDIDGLSNTTGDRKPFTNSLSTLLNADDGTSTPFVVSALGIIYK
ncbi:MAG: hypothetical protein QJT81_07570 [Candidatus Thiothrix putei]|uniref:Uncharacterized protein n=1 Tax=Candidatus Thiothrix putei TaxID=3080811 RepID=A0AA95KJW6_9GAMM|nr:MAG: hypothetical protein QJT81_07570 [Candidatus Thiothrix putei]